MSRSAAATRRSRRRGANPVALFPFLAVLVCTMGSLIVILVILTRQSQLQAAQTAVAKAAEAQNDLAAAKELVEWRVGQMGASQERARTRLAEARLRLGHLEDHARQLRGQIADLQATWKELESSKSQTARRQEDLLAEQNRVAAQIAEARRQLEEAQRAASEGSKSYAVVPYEGPNATRRWPLYVECRADAIVLQPEGIRFTAADFPEPLGPGNPLDTALRAARQALLAQKRIKGDGSDEPYPLLLVRPGGTAAYYVAREAMKSWKSEIGYELIGEDWELKFPQADPAVAQAVQGSVQLARREQQQKAMLAALASAGRRQTTYRAAPGGGLLREGDPEDEHAVVAGPGMSSPAGRHAGSSRPAVSGRPAEPGSAPEPRRSVGDPSAPAPESKTPSQAGDMALRPEEWIPNDTSRKPKSLEKEKPGSPSKSLAEGRGRNWALPDAARKSVPISRPVAVECFADHLVIVLEPGTADGKVIPLGPRTADSIDDFVSGLWEHIKTWGIAGRGMYWRPVLKVRVAADAEARYAELKTLLEGSGLEIEERKG